MSSSDQLKRADTKLRETAAKATPGPWQFVPDLYGDRGAITSTAVAVGGWDTLIIDVPNDSESPAAEWIAIANPAIAEPLAAWLESDAGLVDDMTTAGFGDDIIAARFTPALTVARTVLGESA